MIVIIIKSSLSDTLRAKCQINRFSTFSEDVVQNSLNAYRFELPEDTFHRPKDPKDDCFTLPKDKPLPSGIADVSPCYYNFPIGISLPHFYGGSEDLMKQLKIEGLKASKEKHGSYVIVEPVGRSSSLEPSRFTLIEEKNRNKINSQRAESVGIALKSPPALGSFDKFVYTSLYTVSDNRHSDGEQSQESVQSHR